MKTHSFLSPLPPEQIMNRFSRQTVPDTIGSYFKHHFDDCFYSKIKTNQFRMYFMAAFIRNSYATQINGFVLPNKNGGSIICYHFTKHIQVKVFSVIGLWFLGTLSLMLLFSNPVAAIIPLLMSLGILLPLLISTEKAKDRLLNMLYDICIVSPTSVT